MKKILITGATGMLGTELVKAFKRVPAYEVYGLGRSRSLLLPAQNNFIADLAAPFAVDDIGITPDIIVHTAAITDLNECERNPELANKINVQGSEAVARLGGKNTSFIYISSDSVFDGTTGCYHETDRPDPMNVYARSKLEGERAVLHANKGLTTIIRTNIYGFHSPMRTSLAEWAYKEWAQHKTISGFTDTIFNAVFTGQVADIIRSLIDKNQNYPVLNIGSDAAISKYDFLAKFGAALGFDRGLLRTALSSDFPSTVSRPKNTSLDTSFLATVSEVPDYESGIQRWIKEARECGLI